MVSFLQNNWFIFLAIAAGMMMPAQAAINNRLSGYVESPILSAFISLLVGTVALGIYIVAAGVPVSNLANARNAPAIAWAGGVFGAFFVASAVILVPKIGVALTFSLIIAGQMLITLLIDHFGWFGADVRPVNLPRAIGAAMITIGVVLIRKY
ncbi:MAG TPA: DMT family transporter [Pyrinomonadaceae bacterium]|nr:DMT family transporter [Pyrinomonadaceae bacterium]